MISGAWMVFIFVAFWAASRWCPRVALIGVMIGLPSYLLRADVFGVPTTALEAAVLGTVAGWLMRVVQEAVQNRASWQERRQRIHRAVPRSLLMFLVVTTLGWIVATIASVDVRPSLGAFKAWFIEPLLLGLVILAESKDERDVSILERALLVVLLWVSVAGLFQLVLFRPTVEDGRLSSVFAPVANYYAMFAAPLIVCAVGFVLLRRHRLPALVSVVVGGAALLLSLSFGGMLAVAAGVVTLIVTLLPPQKRTRTLVGFLVLVGAVALLLLPTRQFQEKLNFTTRSSSLVRTQIWRTAIEIGREHPLFGVGPGTFEQAYRATVPKLFFPPLEWLVAKPHNLYLNLWVETGVLGFVGTLGLLVVFLVQVLDRRRSTPRAMVYGAALVAILVHGFVDTPLFKNDLATMTVAIIALGLIAASADNHQTS